MGQSYMNDTGRYPQGSRGCRGAMSQFKHRAPRPDSGECEASNQGRTSLAGLSVKKKKTYAQHRQSPMAHDNHPRGGPDGLFRHGDEFIPNRRGPNSGPGPGGRIHSSSNHHSDRSGGRSPGAGRKSNPGRRSNHDSGRSADVAMTHHRIYRQTEEAAEILAGETDGPGTTSFTDPGTKKGKTHVYRVSAVGAAIKEKLPILA